MLASLLKSPQHLFILVILSFSLGCAEADPKTDPSGKNDDKQGDDSNGGPGGNGKDKPPVLSEQPSLQELEEYWAAKSCKIYACMNRTRESAEICELAKKASGFPFDIFRAALKSIADDKASYVEEAGALCGRMLEDIDVDSDCLGPAAWTYRDRYFKDLEAYCAPSAILAGKGQHDSECSSDAECVAGADCLFDRKPDCQGVCVQRLLINEACDGRWGDCVDVAYCNSGVCQAREYKKLNEICFNHSECASGKCLSRSTSTFSVCVTQNTESGECGSKDDYDNSGINDDDCQGDLYCRALPASTGMLGVCQRAGAPGDACGYAPKCSGNQVCKGYYRKNQGGVVEGECQGRPSTVGESCVPLVEGYDYGDSGCFADLSCNPDTNKCEEAPKVGESCAQPGERCGFLMYCDEGGKCRQKKGPGEEATGHEQCLGYFNSYEGRCEDRSQGCF